MALTAREAERSQGRESRCDYHRDDDAFGEAKTHPAPFHRCVKLEGFSHGSSSTTTNRHTPERGRERGKQTSVLVPALVVSLSR